jgi:peptide/nickel transport system substrate-binding protein
VLDGSVTLDQMAALSSARDSGQIAIDVSSGNVYEQVVFNTYADPITQVPYFADSRVRQAFAWAMDRGTLIQQDMLGLSPLMQSWLPPEHWAFAAEDGLTQYGYDLSAAGALLDSAGWSDQDGDGIREYHGAGGAYACQRGEWSVPEGTVLRPSLITTDLPARLEVAELLQASLRQIGVDLQIHVLPANELFAVGGPLTARSFDLALYSAAVRPDPGGVNLWLGSSMYLHPVSLTPVHRWELEERWITSEQLVEILALNNIPSPENDFLGQNLSGWCHEAANVAIVNATHVFEPEERQAAYAEHQSLWSAEAPAVPLFIRPRIAARRTYVCGIVLGPYDALTWNLAAWFFDETGTCGA